MHNYTAGNLIRGLALGFSTTSKKTLSIDGSYVLSLLDYDNKNALYAGEGYSPNYPNDLLAYLTYFGEHNVEWTGLYNKKGAFEIKQKFDFIYTRIDGNNFGFSYNNNSYYAGIETDTNPDLYIDTIEQTHKALNKSGTAIFFIENQFLYENVERVKQLVDRSFLYGVISLRNYSLLILKKNSKNVKIFDGSTYIKAVFHGKVKSLIEDNALIKDFKKQKVKQPIFVFLDSFCETQIFISNNSTSTTY